jgi:hypothetical protein
MHLTPCSFLNPRRVAAELHFQLPPAYPASCPASCHVRGDSSVSRGLADTWTAALQEVAAQQVRCTPSLPASSCCPGVGHQAAKGWPAA